MSMKPNEAERTRRRPATQLWSRTLVVLMGVNFCSALSFYLVMVKITEFAMHTYGVMHSVAGSLMTAYVISALLTRLFFGGRIDSWGVKRALVVGSVVNAACMALYLLPLPFPLLIAIRVVHGFGFAIMSGSAAAGAALVIPRDRYGEGIGYFSMMQALATGIGPFVAIAITNAFGSYFAMFAVATVFAVLAVCSLALLDIPARATNAGASARAAADATARADADVAILASSDPATRADADSTTQPDSGATAQAASADADVSIRADASAAPRTDTGAHVATQTNASEDSRRPSPSRKALVQWAVVPLASVLLLCYLGYAGVLSFVTLYASELGLSDAVSLYFVVYAAVILVSRPPVGRCVDRKGENSIIYWCFISLAVGFVVLALASNAFMLLASAGLVGFGIGATQSITQAVIARDTPPDELGRANSTFFMSMDLGSGAGPVIIGAIIPMVGYSASYLVLAAVAVLAGVVYHLVHGRKARSRIQLGS